MTETKVVAKDTKKEKKRKSQLKEVWVRLKKNKLSLVGLFILFMVIFIAIFADFIAPYEYDVQDLQNTFQTSSMEHLFGTDEFGRDIFSRIVYGSRISLQVGVIAVGIGVIIGGFLGAIAGYYGGKVDNIIMRFMDVLLSIPQMLLAISIVAALGNSLINLMIAVGVSSIPQYARIVRASVISIKNQEFVESAKATGSGDLRIIFRHVIPNCLAPVIVQATLGIGLAILTAAGLSFLGLGIKPPTPEWGAMLSGSRLYIRDYPHMTLFPGLAIFTTIFGFNVLGDGLRDALDPKLRQ